MILIDILCIGSIDRDGDGKIESAHATSALIRAGGRNIVVDPGTEYMWPAVKTSFRQIGIFPEDVDTVILTHTHSDHTECLKRYPKAKVIVHAGGKTEIPGAETFEGAEYAVCDGVKMVHTPGHCPEHCSVFVDSDRHYVCAGDAVPLRNNFDGNKPPAVRTDADSAIESIAAIRAYADIVIPGHGAPFAARRRGIGICFARGHLPSPESGRSICMQEQLKAATDPSARFQPLNCPKKLFRIQKTQGAGRISETFAARFPRFASAEGK